MSHLSVANLVTAMATCTASFTSAMLVQTKGAARQMIDKSCENKRTLAYIEDELKACQHKIEHEREQTKELIQQNRILSREKNLVDSDFHKTISEISTLKYEREEILRDLTSVVRECSVLQEVKKNERNNLAKVVTEKMIEDAEKDVESLEEQNKELQEEIDEMRVKLSYSLNENREKRTKLRGVMKNNVILQIRFYLLKSHRKFGGSDDKTEERCSMTTMTGRSAQRFEMKGKSSVTLKSDVTEHSRIDIDDLVQLLKEKKDLETRLLSVEKEIHNIRSEITPKQNKIDYRKTQMLLENMKMLPKPEISLKHVSVSEKPKCIETPSTLSGDISSVGGGSGISECKHKKCLRPVISPEEFVKPQGHEDDCTCVCCNLREKLSVLNRIDSHIPNSIFSVNQNNCSSNESLCEPDYGCERPPSRSSRNQLPRCRQRGDDNRQLPKH